MSKTKVLVTGGAGFIGSHVADLLIQKGYRVTIVDNLSTGKKENINPSAHFRQLDIVDPITWGLLDNDFKYVFHLAALARIQPSIADPISSNETNVIGTLRVLEYCRRAKAKLIFSGSSSIYAGDKLPTMEEDPKKPKSPYALQKLISELYISLYAELYDLKYSVLRYFNVYGERQITSGAYAALVGIFLNQKASGEPLSITNDGEQRRDFTYVKDVALANFLAMEWQGTFNIGTGKNYSVNEIADMIGGEKKYIGNREGEAKETLANNLKAYTAGWKPSLGIEEWIENALKL